MLHFRMQDISGNIYTSKLNKKNIRKRKLGVRKTSQVQPPSGVKQHTTSLTLIKGNQ